MPRAARSARTLERLRPVATAIDRVSALVGRGASWLVVLMMALGAWNAVARHLGRDVGLQLASNALLEAQWYLFGAAFLLAAAWTLQRDRHVRVDVLHSRFSPRTRAWIDLVGTAAFLVPTCVAVVVLSLPAVQSSIAVREVSPDPGGLPRWPLKPLVPICFVLLGLQGLAIALRRADFLLGGAESEAGDIGSSAPGAR